MRPSTSLALIEELVQTTRVDVLLLLQLLLLLLCLPILVDGCYLLGEVELLLIKLLMQYCTPTHISMAQSKI